MLFSVVIPTCHRNDKLRECLDLLQPSVQGVSADLYEIVVADDGRDYTAESLIKENYPGVRWVAGPRTGPPGNRNKGAQTAKGDWIIFADDDCLPSPGFLRGYQNALTPEILAYEGKITCEDGINSPLYTAPINLNGGAFWTCNVMMKRDFFHEFGGFDEDFALISNEDTDLRERLKHAGVTIKFVPEAVVDHPPRPISFKSRRRFHESEVRMWYLTGNRSSRRISVKILRSVIALNIRRALEFPFGIDTIRWLGQSVTEFIYVCTHLSQWNRKYRGVFDDKLPPYSYPY
jgi:GT2 family glycosyltransferase